MKALSNQSRIKQVRMVRQRGLVLFFSLIALVVMSLAAVALIRSVDTSSLIAANLAFKRAATASSDSGTELATIWLTTVNNANIAKDVAGDPTHPFNITNLAANPGYFSSADPALNLTAEATWNNTNSAFLGTDSTGNTRSYIIQRMCRVANTPLASADCLFSAPTATPNPQDPPTYQSYCPKTVANCPKDGQSPIIRITVRTSGPKNTYSYVQTFVY